MSIRLGQPLESQLHAVAMRSGITLDEAAARAVQEYLLLQDDFDVALDEGLAAEEAGKLLDHSEVVARVNKLLAV